VRQQFVMLGVIPSNFDLMVPHGRLTACIALLEEGLRSLRRTPFHIVLGRDFLHQTGPATSYMVDFHRMASASMKVGALYFEMNGFPNNTDRWYCEGFAYRKAGDMWDLDWLAKWAGEAEEQFPLKGMEPVQEAFAGLYGDSKQPLGVQMAGELAEHLVTARFMQLIAAAHKAAKRRYSELKGLPVIATAHDWETVHQTT
jgi:hypothetical protein